MTSNNRSSIKHNEHNLITQRHRERIARDIAFEAGVTLEANGTSIFICGNGNRALLCTVQDQKYLWRQALAELCKTYPHLARQS